MSEFGLLELANELEKTSRYTRQQTASSRPPTIKTTRAGRKTVKTNVRLNAPMRYAERLTEWLYDQYNLAHAQTAFRRRQGSYYHFVENGIHQIVYGDASATRAHDKGFREYVTLQHLAPVYKGLKGIHQLVLHEFAHVLQQEAGGFGYNSVHNKHFVYAYRELMIVAPFGCM